MHRRQKSRKNEKNGKAGHDDRSLTHTASAPDQGGHESTISYGGGVIGAKPTGIALPL
jgi:hypothetical protein